MIVAQEPNKMDSIFAQDLATEFDCASELVMMDIADKIVFKTQVVLNGNAVEVEFGNLPCGV